MECQPGVAGGGYPSLQCVSSTQQRLIHVVGLSKCGRVNAFCQEKKSGIGHSIEREIYIHSVV